MELMKHRFDHSKLFAEKPQCGGKRCYKTRKDAEAVGLEQEIINPELTLVVYHCTQCGMYHLTRRTEENG